MRALRRLQAPRAFATSAVGVPLCTVVGVVALFSFAACSHGDDTGFGDGVDSGFFFDDASNADSATHLDGSSHLDGSMAQPDAASVDSGADAHADASVDAGVDGAVDTGAADSTTVDAPEGGSVDAGNGPTAPPTAPAQAASAVISLLSTTYAGTAGDESSHVDSYEATCFGPPGTSVTDYTIASGNETVKAYTIPASSFAIIETIGDTGGTPTPPDSPICHGGTQTGANLINASAMTAVHVDVWTPTGSTNFQVHLILTDSTDTIAGPGAAVGATAGSDEASGALTAAAGVWTSIDVPFASLGPPGAVITKLGLVKLFTSDAGTFYVDNLYFHQ